MPQAYTIVQHGEMITDRGRTGTYAAAVKARNTPGCVVFDIGPAPESLRCWPTSMGREEFTPSSRIIRGVCAPQPVALRPE